MADEPIEPTSKDPGGTQRVPAENFFALPADSAAPAIARRYLLEHASGLPSKLIDDALLLISELVTNAVQHGQPDITLKIRPHPPGIGVSVQDRGDRPPVGPTGTPDPRANSGRGLHIVDALSTAWGVEPTDPPPGKIVWFELDPPPRSPG